MGSNNLSIFNSDMNRFLWRLCAFLGPLFVLVSVPLAVMLLSREVFAPDALAQWHSKAGPDAVYGPGYTNPDKRYKLVSAILHDTPVMSLGTSRVMQFRSSFFRGGEETFYNAGGIISRVTHLTRTLAHLPEGKRVRYLIVGLDQWSYNDNWNGSADDPGVELEYKNAVDSLGNIRNGIRAWPDFFRGKISLSKLAAPSEDLGVNGRLRGNGFRRDGSYVYADILRDPRMSADFEFRDTLSRIRAGRDRFETGTVVSERALRETTHFLEAARARHFEVIGFLPPFAPSIERQLAASVGHSYLRSLPAKLRAVFEAAGVAFHDFTDCTRLGCEDAEFIDGFHGGDTVYARMTVEMARSTPWLSEIVAPTLGEQIERASGLRSFSRAKDVRENVDGVR